MGHAGEEWAAHRECRGEAAGLECLFTSFFKKKKFLSEDFAKSGTKVAQISVHHRESGPAIKRVELVPDLCPHGFLRLQDKRPQEEGNALSV